MDAPLTLWTIPELASVGLSGEEAKEMYGDKSVLEVYVLYCIMYTSLIDLLFHLYLI